mmetsp:Transcript_12565/g.29124  ORF Transcript_12565/g.29124 Transcript_12565/m.29124 type:complete len:160 (+) Transcript_12565:38-517(+)
MNTTINNNNNASPNNNTKTSNIQKRQTIPSGTSNNNPEHQNLMCCGTWQRDDGSHEEHRKNTILAIAQFLRERKDSSPEWTRNVPLIAKRLELSLYRTSQSFEEYIDDSTLKNRLKKMAAKTLHLKRARDAAAAASIRRAKTQKQKNTHKESGSVQKLA